MSLKFYINPKVLSKIELFYIITGALTCALYFKSGGVYANNIPTIVSQNRVIFKLNNIVSKVQPKTTPLENEIKTKITDLPKSNRFPWGQCTWYVATKRNVTWSGHARSWYRNAKAAGRTVGQFPRVGAIVVLNQGYYGHVGYVETVKGDIVTYSESNNPGLGKITWQTANYQTLPIIGFIY